MNVLNNDCQLLIIKYLCLKDQFALFEATKEESTNRWNSNLRYNWQHQLSFSLDAGLFLYLERKIDVLSDFLSSISPTVKQLDLQSITLDNLNCLMSCKFPKMMTVKYTLEKFEAYWIGDRVIEKIAEIFPGLENIQPYGVIDCIYLKNFMSLRKLKLRDCWILPFQIHNCEQIGELKTLEELIIPGKIFKEDIYKVFMLLPKLRSLTAYADGGLFVERMLSKGIEEITFCESFGSVTTQTFKRLTKLRKLTIINQLQYPGLLEVITALPRLEHLDIVSSPIFDSDCEFWDVVDCCPSLKIFNISNTDIGDDFFNISRSLMKKTLDKRTTPLTLLCDNRHYSDLIGSYFKHPNLNVSLNHIDWTVFDGQYFCTIKFSALDNE